MDMDQTQQPPPDRAAPDRQPIWRFRGHELGSADFTETMLHLYRGEQARSNTWRARLDTTTYWAVITVLVTIVYLFASPDTHYILLVLSTLLVAIILGIEARRYRYYELWSYRVRLMETDFIAAMLVPPYAPHPEWAESLAHTLLRPEFPISNLEAFGRRFRRNYMLLFILLGVAWALKGFLHPVAATSWDVFMSRYALGPIPGQVMTLIGVIFNAALFLIGLATSGMHRATGEVLPKYGEFPIIGGLREALQANKQATAASGGPAGLIRRRTQLLTLVVSSNPQAIADRVLKEMNRGVTALHGKGMYTKQDREVLLVALTVTEVAQLEQIVRTADPNAFVMVAPAQEILGRGFQPLGS